MIYKFSHLYKITLFLGFMVFSLSAPAETPIRELKVSKRGDVNLNCGQLSHEADTMRAIIFNTQDIRDNSADQSTGINVAGTAASFLIGTVTGGIGLAAAGFLIDENVGDIANSAERMQDTAQQRRALMAGIYEAKGCFGPLDHAMRNPGEELYGTVVEVMPAAGEEFENPIRASSGYNN